MFVLQKLYGNIITYVYMKFSGKISGILGTFLLLLLPLSITTFEANAQSLSASSFEPENTNNTGGINTFSASGMINSLVIKGSNQSTSPENNITFPANNQTSYTLGGHWNLEVIGGNITDFNTKITMVHFDGTNRHDMSFVNFRSNETNLQLPSSGSTKITGLVDVMEHGKIKWGNVTSNLDINKYNTINLNVNDEQVEQHFNGQPIHGIVNSLMHGFTKDSFTTTKQ
jgi:hypothetical protein